MMRRYFLPLFVILASLVAVPHLASAQKKDDYSAMATDILRLVNKYRATKGLNPLEMKEAIVKQAQSHSRNMGSGKVDFGHDGMDERVTKANKELGQDAAGWAENVAVGQRTAEAAVDSCLNSKVHKQNIEGNYTQTGIGIAKGKDGMLYFTQIFIRGKQSWPKPK